MHLSVIIFNTVVNLLVDTITQSHHHLGCSLSSTNQCAKAASLLSSRDSMVHHLASQKTLAEASTVRQNFKPYPLVY